MVADATISPHNKAIFRRATGFVVVVLPRLSFVTASNRPAPSFDRKMRQRLQAQSDDAKSSEDSPSTLYESSEQDDVA